MAKVKCENVCDEADIILFGVDEDELCQKCKRDGYLMDVTECDDVMIPLEKAVKILMESSRIVLDDDLITFAYPNANYLEDSFLNIIVTKNHRILFQASNNGYVRIKDCSMYLFDSKGVEHELLILTPKNIENSI